MIKLISKRAYSLILLSIISICIMLIPLPSQAAETDEAFTMEIIDSISAVKKTSLGNPYYYLIPHFYYRPSISFGVRGKSPKTERITITATSSDNNIAEPPSNNTETIFTGNNDWFKYFSYKLKNNGKATLNVSGGNKSVSIPVYCLPAYTKITSINKADSCNISINWEKTNGADGYLVFSYDTAYSQKKNIKQIAKITNPNQTAVKTSADWGKEKTYFVCPYINGIDNTLICKTDFADDYDYTSYSKIFKLDTPNVSIKNVSAKKNKVTINLKTDTSAKSYKLYVSNIENGKYTLLKSLSSKKSQYSYKAKYGKVYFYKLEAEYKNGRKLTSDSDSIFIAPKNMPKATKKTTKIKNSGRGQYNQFGGNWASEDSTFYYELKGKLHVVTLSGKTIYDYTIDNKNNVKSTKKIKIKKGDILESFYKGIDDNLYVVVGYRNGTEKTNKTVIQVLKYNSKWRNQKICSIKSNVSHGGFKGIVYPFDASGCSMDMIGSNLYLHTGRKMFRDSYGIAHQSNISFVIDTKKMKCKSFDNNYVSHSFNQITKAQNKTLYQVDHGDAYPRGIKLSIISDLSDERPTVTSNNIFNITGNTGDNYTGLKLGGMAVGKKNVITCGISVPHNYPIKGVTGASYTYARNVFISVTKKKTGENKVKWITNFNPSTSKTTVSEARLVKVSDDRMVILYNEIKNRKATLCYRLINNNGKVLKKKTYSKIPFSMESDPIVKDGSIVWSTYSNGKNYVCRIPILQ